MYKMIGKFSGDIDELLALVPLCKPNAGRGGYCCTDPNQTHAVYWSKLKDIFRGNWTRTFLAVIAPNGGNISPHWGAGEVIEANSYRYHLPLQTNEYSWSMSNNHWQLLERGVIYEFDPRLIHASINWGDQLRIHFVVDIQDGLIWN